MRLALVLVLSFWGSGAFASNSMILRERLALDFSKNWNEAKTLGKFLEKHVDQKIPATERERFQHLTAGYRWFPAPKVLPIKDTLIFLDGANRTLHTVKIESVAPLIVKNGETKLAFKNLTEYFSHLETVEKGLPNVLRVLEKVKGKHSNLFDLLVPNAHAAGPAGVLLGAAVMGGGVLAYSVFSGARTSAAAEGFSRGYAAGRNSSGDQYTTVNINIPDSMNINMRNLTEEAARREQEDLRRRRLDFRSSLGRWVNENITSGACEDNEQFAPRTQFSATAQLNELNFRQRVSGAGEHRMEISVPGAPETFVIEKAFARNADIAANHRVFADEVTVLRRCVGTNCRVVDPNEFSTALTAAALGNRRAAAEAAAEAEWQALSREKSPALRAALASHEELVRAQGQSRQEVDTAVPRPNFDEIHAERARIREARNEIVSQVTTAVTQLQQATRWTIRGSVPSHFDLENHRPYSLAENVLTQETTHFPSLVGLRQRLIATGAVQRFADLDRQMAELRQRQEQAERDYTQARRQYFVSRGLTPQGDIPHAQRLTERLLRTDFCKEHRSACARLNFNWQFTEQDIAAVENDVRAQIFARHLSPFGRAQSRLADHIATNYALGMCCDEPDCRTAVSSQMAIRSRAGRAGDGQPFQEPAARPAR